MGSTFVALLPFAIAGAFVPTWTSRVIILLASDRPVGNGLAFIFGNFTYRMLLGLVVLYIVGATNLQGLTESGSTPTSVFVAAAALLWSLAFWLWRKGSNDTGELPGWLKALERVPPILSFAYGAFLVALPGVQYVYFLGGMNVLANARLSTTETLILLVIFCALLQAMLLVPVVAFALFKDTAESKLTAIKNWISRNGDRVTAGLLVLFGGYALILAFV